MKTNYSFPKSLDEVIIVDYYNKKECKIYYSKLLHFKEELSFIGALRWLNTCWFEHDGTIKDAYDDFMQCSPKFEISYEDFEATLTPLVEKTKDIVTGCFGYGFCNGKPEPEYISFSRNEVVLIYYALLSRLKNYLTPDTPSAENCSKLIDYFVEKILSVMS